jgi:hypothetical protein
MCELIHLTTNGLLSAFPPLRWPQGQVHRLSTWAFKMFCVCRGNRLHFLKNELPTLCIDARTLTSAPRPKGCLSGGRMAPHVVPFTWPVLCSCSICWRCCCWYFVIIVQHFPSQLCTISFFCLIFNLAFAFYFPLSGGNRDGTTSAKR